MVGVFALPESQVIKRRAPNGALRPIVGFPVAVSCCKVIKHRAPNGALRRERVVLTVDGQLVIKRRPPNGILRRGFVDTRSNGGVSSHKAPSAKRRIMTPG